MPVEQPAMSAGLVATSMLAALRAATFSAAVPLPPLMIAPGVPSGGRESSAAGDEGGDGW